MARALLATIVVAIIVLVTLLWFHGPKSETATLVPGLSPYPNVKIGGTFLVHRVDDESAFVHFVQSPRFRELIAKDCRKYSDLAAIWNSETFAVKAAPMKTQDSVDVQYSVATYYWGSNTPTPERRMGERT